MRTLLSAAARSLFVLSSHCDSQKPISGVDTKALIQRDSPVTKSARLFQVIDIRAAADETGELLARDVV